MSHGVAIAIPLALGAALLHALWNVLLKTGGDPLRVAARAAWSSILVVTPLAAVAWFVAGRPTMPLAAWLIAALSSGVELGYFIVLAEAYRRGDLSVVYPLARGTAPLLAVLAGLLILREHLSPLALLGVLCLLAGIWIVRRPVMFGPAVLPALATGVTIAIYTTIDSIGVRLTSPLLYDWVLSVFIAVLLALWVRIRPPPPAPETGRALLVGLLMLGAYLMVLIALSVAPLTVVSPLRESAIVLVSGWSVWRLGERRGAVLRLTGAAAILGGIVLLTLG